MRKSSFFICLRILGAATTGEAALVTRKGRQFFLIVKDLSLEW
jgi:hypothetical protein